MNRDKNLMLILCNIIAFLLNFETTATATATASAAGTIVSFPDRFRTAQAYFAPKFEIECVHAWILTLIIRLATTLSTTYVFLGGAIQGPARLNAYP